jgi:hypothetical protein
VLSTLRIQLTAAAALTRPAAIRHAKEGRRSCLRMASAATYAWQISKNFGGRVHGSKPGLCRMPSASLTLDPSQQEEGRP